jgi:putative heme-binding domain-containing protein
MFGGGQINDMSPNDIFTPVGYTLPGLGQPFRDDKGSTLEIPSGVNFPEAWRDGLLTGHLLGKNYVLYTPMEMRDGAYKKAGDSLRLVESSNKSFRPVDMVFGLDGSLLISDFYYPIIGHAQHGIRDENRDHAHGRIYRVVRKDAPLSKSPKIVDAEILELFELLENPLIRVRELARMEIGERAERDRAVVLTELRRGIDTVLASGSAGEDGTLRLELLWLCERIEAYEDTRLIKAMLASSNVQEHSMAVRSIRYWVNALGEATSTKLMQSALSSEETRVGVQAISTLSHLQRDHEWAEAMILGHRPASPALTGLLNEAKKFRLPPASPTYPILDYDKTTQFTTWLPSDLGAVTYFKAAKSGQAAMLFTDGKFSEVRLNESVVHGKAATLARTTSIRVTLQEGINKIEVASTKRKPKRRRGKQATDTVGASATQTPDVQTIYLTDELGKRPEVELSKNTDIAKQWSRTFGESLESNWLNFARQRYATNCMACHSTDGTRRVGPTFKGLVGKEQMVLDPRGAQRQVVVDEAYIRNAILNPLAEYPKDTVPLMPKLPLTKIEVDYLTRFVMEQETLAESDSSPTGPPLEQLLALIDPSELAKAARSTGDAQRGAKLFFKETLSCVKCHNSSEGERLGPNLTAKQDTMSDVYLVESLLLPSKVISKGFEPLIVLTEDGLIRTGFQVSEDSVMLLLRDANTGKEMKIPKSDITDIVPSKVSVMPAGLVNQLSDQDQFLDLVRFLMDVNEGGPSRFESLKNSVAN